MARTDDKPKSHAIALVGRGKHCATCNDAIENDTLAFAEAYIGDDGKWARAHRNARQPRRSEFSDDDRRSDYFDATNPDVSMRYHHLACAARTHALKLKSALGKFKGEMPERAEIEQHIERALCVEDVAAADPAYAQFIAKMASGDDEVVDVFADWLQQRDDPRGELIAVQRALETATPEEKPQLLETERKILATHRKQLVPERLEKPSWRRGFIDRVMLTGAGVSFAHPSLALVRTIQFETDRFSQLVLAANLPSPLPRTLHTLELVGDRIGKLGPVVATAPQLHRLMISGNADFSGFAHPALVELELRSAHSLRDLDGARLPKLARVIVGDEPMALALAESRIARGVAVFVHEAISASTIEVLRAAGATYEPPVAAAPAPSPPPAIVREWRVRHTRKPELGIGKVIEETDAGLRVDFEVGGEKLIRNVELLEEV